MPRMASTLGQCSRVRHGAYSQIPDLPSAISSVQTLCLGR
jgi:hypothetical protein